VPLSIKNLGGVDKDKSRGSRADLKLEIEKSKLLCKYPSGFNAMQLNRGGNQVQQNNSYPLEDRLCWKGPIAFDVDSRTQGSPAAAPCVAVCQSLRLGGPAAR